MFVIYDKQTTRILKPNKADQFKTQSAAQRQLNKYCENNNSNPLDYAIAYYSTFTDTIEKSVERTNIMTGEKYMEKVNTPPYMSPACESYWSM